MKHMIKRLAGVAIALVTAASCTSLLDEVPRTSFTPDFFKTEAGVNGGLTALYSHLRDLYGGSNYLERGVDGTDELTWGESGGGGFQIMDMAGFGGDLLSSNSAANGLWGFSYINTANGIIKNAAEVGLSDALIAEARFFRAYEYFYMVQAFGGVPLDLGSGELEFNESAVRTSVRNTVPEVYEKAIFPDLEFAVANLPEVGRVTGGLTKNLARLFLAKSYLAYAWWLENPNDIPTWPECTRNKAEAPSYFQKAYDTAVAGIENPGPFKLMDYFYLVHLGSNDRNAEIMLYADHTETNAQYNGSDVTGMGTTGSSNTGYWMINWNYPTMNGTGPDGKKVTACVRTDRQPYGRPWSRMAPTQECLNTFTDKKKDSRFDGTFTYIYHATWKFLNPDVPYLQGANPGTVINPDDPFLTFVFDEDEQGIVYDKTTADYGLGIMPGRADFVVGGSGVSRRIYPGPWKIGPYRTNTGTGIGEPNCGSTRPVNLAKFSEFYFVAAEAAVKGASTKAGKSARELINVIRARAGKWAYKVNEDHVYEADFSAELTAATPATITVDYLLDEMTREYYADGFRWFDLVRTQKWAERAGKYTIAGTVVGDHDPVVYTRKIEKYHYLRPIPKGQISAMDMPEEDLKKYQNPGYPFEK